MVGKATPDRKAPREWTPASKSTRKTQRDGHNSGVKIWSLCSVSITLSHANLWTTLSNPCNKVRGKYICKEVSCVFLTACVVYYYICYHCVGMYPVYICMQHILIWCMCQQSSSRIQNEPGYRQRQFLSITTRHQRKGQGKMLELKEVERNKNRNKPSTIRGTDRRGKNRKKRRKQCNVLEEKKKKKKKKTRNKNKLATEKRKERKKKQEM